MKEKYFVSSEPLHYTTTINYLPTRNQLKHCIVDIYLEKKCCSKTYHHRRHLICRGPCCCPRRSCRSRVARGSSGTGTGARPGAAEREVRGRLQLRRGCLLSWSRRSGEDPSCWPWRGVQLARECWPDGEDLVRVMEFSVWLCVSPPQTWLDCSWLGTRRNLSFLAELQWRYWQSLQSCSALTVSNWSGRRLRTN